MDNLRQLLADGGCPYPYLREVLTALVQMPRFAPQDAKPIARADGYKVTESNPYQAHPSDGPATFSRYDGKGPLVVGEFSL